jgi:hypothetical protein
MSQKGVEPDEAKDVRYAWSRRQGVIADRDVGVAVGVKRIVHVSARIWLGGGASGQPAQRHPARFN